MSPDQLQSLRAQVGLLNGSRTRLHNFKPSASGFENQSDLPQDVELGQPQPIMLRRGGGQQADDLGKESMVGLVISTAARCHLGGLGKVGGYRARVSAIHS